MDKDWQTCETAVDRRLIPSFATFHPQLVRSVGESTVSLASRNEGRRSSATLSTSTVFMKPGLRGREFFNKGSTSQFRGCVDHQEVCGSPSEVSAPKIVREACGFV